MNILHLKYAVSIADNGSINKAAEEIHVAQPNLSRVIKELEADLGITIFQRSAHGMILTPEGEEFVGRARKILEQVDDMGHSSAFPFPRRGQVTSPTRLPIFPVRWAKRTRRSFTRKPMYCRLLKTSWKWVITWASSGMPPSMKSISGRCWKIRT